MGQPCRSRCPIGTIGHIDSGPRGPPGRLTGGKVHTPTGVDQHLRFAAAGETAHQHRAIRVEGPREQDFARMWIGRTLLGKQVVPVIEDNDQPERIHRGEGRGTCAHDDGDDPA